MYGALTCVLFLRYSPAERVTLIKEHLAPFTIIFFAWTLMLGASGLYNLRLTKNGKVFIYRLVRAMMINVIIAILVLYLIPWKIEPRRNLILIASFATAFIFLWRMFFNILILKTPSARVLFVGVNREVDDLIDYLLKNPQLGQRPVALVTSDLSVSHQLPGYEIGKNLSEIIKETKSDTVVILPELEKDKATLSTLFQAITTGVWMTKFPQFYEMLTGKIPISLIEKGWFLENLIGVKKNFYDFFKRLVDVLLSIILGIPALVFTPFIILAIKFDSSGPIFYRQKRVGQNGQEFWLIKYRSMIKDADNLGGDKGNGRDARHTRAGRFLRKSYLDEFPQIINVLKGEMSLIGPRPERPEYIAELKRDVPFYDIRLMVKPGITGWAQTNMENDASVEDAPEKMQYDLYYIKNRSLALDLLITLKTVGILLRRQGR